MTGKKRQEKKEKITMQSYKCSVREERKKTEKKIKYYLNYETFPWNRRI